MDEWIRSLIDAATKPIRVIAQGAADRIAGVYNNFTNALSRARNGFGNWVTRGRNWVSAQTRNALAVAYLLAYMLRVYLPGLGAKWLLDARTVAVALINAGIAIVLRELDRLRTWAWELIQRGAHALDVFTDWITRKLGEALVTLYWLRDTVFNLLSAPERLAAWLVGAMATALLNYAMDHAAEFAEIAWRHRKVLESRSVDIVDDFLDRVM